MDWETVEEDWADSEKAVVVDSEMEVVAARVVRSVGEVEEEAAVNR